MGKEVRSESLAGGMASTLANSARDMGSISTLSTIFLIFITLMTLAP